MPRSKKPKLSEPQQPTSSALSLKDALRLLRPRSLELQVVIQAAERQLDDQLRASWYQACHAPDVFKARRKGVDEAFRRLEALLTEPER